MGWWQTPAAGRSAGHEAGCTGPAWLHPARQTYDAFSSCCHKTLYLATTHTEIDVSACLEESMCEATTICELCRNVCICHSWP